MPNRIVVLGGGTGAPTLLKSLAELLPETSFAIICPVTDTGRSTGVVRRMLDIPATGDLRHCLTTLSPNEELGAALEQRLEGDEGSEFQGMATGNLVLGSMAASLRDIGKATAHLAHVLNVPHDVMPVTTANVDLAATLVTGEQILGEINVRRPGKPAIQSLSVVGNERVSVWPPAAEALTHADVIVIGPGSLWTSVVAVLAVPGVREAIVASSATVVFNCNTTTQPGQTDGLGVTDHVAIIAHYLGRWPDIVLANSGRTSAEREEALAMQGLHLIYPDAGLAERLAYEKSCLIAEDLLGQTKLSRSLWQKVETAYHDMDRLAAIVIAAVQNARSGD